MGDGTEAIDGARGIQAGLREAELAIPLHPDLFHLLHEGHRLTPMVEITEIAAWRI